MALQSHYPPLLHSGGPLFSDGGLFKSITPELNHFITIIIIITHICKQLTMLCCHLHFVLKQCLPEGDTVYTVLLSLGNPYHDIIHENEVWVLHKTTWTSMILGLSFSWTFQARIWCQNECLKNSLQSHQSKI